MILRTDKVSTTIVCNCITAILVPGNLFLLRVRCAKERRFMCRSLRGKEFCAI
jgi:hypothetical protein